MQSTETNTPPADDVREARCERVSPEAGYEDEGYTCTTHNMAWEECREHRATQLIKEIKTGDFEDRAWMIDALERAASLLAFEVRPRGTVTDAERYATALRAIADGDGPDFVREFARDALEAAREARS